MKRHKLTVHVAPLADCSLARCTDAHLQRETGRAVGSVQRAAAAVTRARAQGAAVRCFALVLNCSDGSQEDEVPWPLTVRMPTRDVDDDPIPPMQRQKLLQVRSLVRAFCEPLLHLAGEGAGDDCADQIVRVVRAIAMFNARDAAAFRVETRRKWETVAGETARSIPAWHLSSKVSCCHFYSSFAYFACFACDNVQDQRPPDSPFKEPNEKDLIKSARRIAITRASPQRGNCCARRKHMAKYHLRKYGAKVKSKKALAKVRAIAVPVSSLRLLHCSLPLKLLPPKLPLPLLVISHLLFERGSQPRRVLQARLVELLPLLALLQVCRRCSSSDSIRCAALTGKAAAAAPAAAAKAAAPAAAGAAKPAAAAAAAPAKK